MLKARTKSSDGAAAPFGAVVLDFDHRQKHRFLAVLESGEELAVHLPRGSVLADGDVLVTEQGERIAVRAAEEELSVATAADPLLLARLAYHLGNRHVALQIEPGRLSYLHDHVLDDMVQGLGGELSFRRAAFFPESGAYGNHGGARAHGHEHGHAHSHGHEHLHPRIHTHENTEEEH